MPVRLLATRTAPATNLATNLATPRAATLATHLAPGRWNSAGLTTPGPRRSPRLRGPLAWLPTFLVAMMLPHASAAPSRPPVARTSTSTVVAAEPLAAELRDVADGTRRRASLQLPDGTRCSVSFGRVQNRGQRDATLVGTIEGIPGSSALFVLHGEHLVGDVRGAGIGALSLRVRQGGGLEFSGSAEDDPRLEPCGAVGDDALPDSDGPRAADTRNADSGPPCLSALAVIDMLFVATPAAVEELGGIEMIEADALLSAALADETLKNSQIPARIRLVHVAELAYVESGNMAVDLVRLRGTTDGHLDEVHALRDAHGADLVCLRVATGQYCGIAFIAKDPPLATSGFSVVQCGGAVPAHEWGHSLGACHAPGDDNGVGACDVQGGAFPFSHGHRFEGPSGELFRTMMAYVPGTKILHYSNPRVSHLGTPTGVAGEADNATTISLLAPAVAAFRPSVFVDCDADGLDDLCAILDALVPDCDGNWVPDGCDLARGTSVDRDGDGVLDVCEPPADLDDDGDVDSTDLALLLGSWGTCPRCPADLDESGSVDAVDLGLLLAAW